jgi:hypothetical protein
VNRWACPEPQVPGWATVRTANTLIEVSNLIGGYEVEIEAEAVVG